MEPESTDVSRPEMLIGITAKVTKWLQKMVNITISAPMKDKSFVVDQFGLMTVTALLLMVLVQEELLMTTKGTADTVKPRLTSTTGLLGWLTLDILP
jgi:hypothetical protein